MRRTFIAVVLATAVFAGCGGDDDEESASTPTATEESTPAAGGETGGEGGGETLAFSAPEDGSLVFDQSDMKAKAGKVTVTFSNPSQVPHAVEIKGEGVSAESETVTGGDAPPITVDLKPGTYEFLCPVPGHEAAGMKGTLTVE